MIKRFTILLLAAVLMVCFELGRGLLAPGMPGLFSDAKAVVGRPLTPVSVAGVGRRTARRCATGVYNC